MALNQYTINNFGTLKSATNDGNLALMECEEKATGKKVPMVCAVYIDEDDQYNFVPLAVMLECNPYDDYLPPTP